MVLLCGAFMLLFDFEFVWGTCGCFRVVDVLFFLDGI